MKKMSNALVLLEDDYVLLVSYLKGSYQTASFDRHNAEDLYNELKKAKRVNKDHFPHNVVRLNSTVKIKAKENDNVMELMLVTPDRADIKERKISVLAPIGTALLGFRQGQTVEWQMPSGKKTFTILEVSNKA